MSIKYFNGKPSATRHKPTAGVDFAGEPCITIQSAAADCDIHVILKKYERGQISPAEMNKDVAKMLYGDFSNIPSLQDMYQMVDDAKQQFDALPTAVKAQFGYDPRAFIRAASDEQNRDLFVKLGLIEAKPAEVKKDEVSPAPTGSAVKADPIPTT